MLSYCCSHRPTLVPSLSSQFRALNRPASSSVSARNPKILQPNSNLQENKWRVSCSSQEGFATSDGVEHFRPQEPLKPEPELSSSTHGKKDSPSILQKVVDAVQKTIRKHAGFVIQIACVVVVVAWLINFWEGRLNMDTTFNRIMLVLVSIIVCFFV